MKALDMTTFKKKIYAPIMCKGILAVTEAACDITGEDKEIKTLLRQLTEAHFEDRFMSPLLITQVSDQFTEAAYHFQKLSNLAESIAEAKTQLCLESKVAMSEEMTELTEEEQELVDSVVNDAPTDLVDSIAQKVASALAADQRRAEAIQQSLELMKQDGADSDELLAVANEASQVPATLLSALAMYQGSQHLSYAMSEGSGFKDPDQIIRLNAENIRNTATATYAMFETFNTLKEYTVTETKDIIFSFQTGNFK